MRTVLGWLLIASLVLLFAAPARAQDVSEEYVWNVLLPAAQEMMDRGLTENNIYELMEIIERYGVLNYGYQGSMEISSWETAWLLAEYQWHIQRDPYVQSLPCSETAMKADMARRLSRTLYAASWLNIAGAGLAAATGAGAILAVPLSFAAGVTGMSAQIANWIAQDYAAAPCTAG